MTGAIRSSSAATERWTSVSWRGRQRGVGHGRQLYRATGPARRPAPRAAARTGRRGPACPTVDAVLRRPSLLPALGAVAACGGARGGGPRPCRRRRRHRRAPPGPPPGAPAAPPPSRTSPLAVTIDTLTPSYVPRRGPVRVTGSVTNNDDAPWTTVNTVRLRLRRPDPHGRRAGRGQRDRPGRRRRRPDHRARAPTTPSTGSSPARPRSSRSGCPRAGSPSTEPGVYWFGVHALGEGPDGRDDGADGRARTFLPLVAPTRRRRRHRPRRCRCAHGLPHAPDGSLDATSRAGPPPSPRAAGCGAMVDFGTAAGSRPLTWLVDPALPDAVARAGRRQPAPLARPRPRRTSRGRRRREHAPGRAPSRSRARRPATARDRRRRPSRRRDHRRPADAWLDAPAGGRCAATQVLALPYGDLDVAAAAEQRPRRSTGGPAQRSGTELRSRWGLPMTRAVAPPGGLPRRAPACADAGAATPSWSATGCCRAGSPTAGRAPAGTPVVATSSGAASGGPGPDDPLAAGRAAPADPRRGRAAPARAPARSRWSCVLPADWAPTEHHRLLRGPRRRLAAPHHGRRPRSRRRAAPGRRPTARPTPRGRGPPRARRRQLRLRQRR